MIDAQVMPYKDVPRIGIFQLFVKVLRHAVVHGVLKEATSLNNNLKTFLKYKTLKLSSPKGI